MSYDLRIWCVRALADADTGVLESGEGWLVSVSGSRRILDDIPHEVSSKLDGVHYIVDLSLEPIDAPAAGETAARKVARAIAETTMGVILGSTERFVCSPAKCGTPETRQYWECPASVPEA